MLEMLFDKIADRKNKWVDMGLNKCGQCIVGCNCFDAFSGEPQTEANMFLLCMHAFMVSGFVDIMLVVGWDEVAVPLVSGLNTIVYLQLCFLVWVSSTWVFLFRRTGFCSL